jgi:Peptidase C13 family
VTERITVLLDVSPPTIPADSALAIERQSESTAAAVPSSSAVRDVVTNVRSGIRISLLRSVRFEDFRVSVDQLVWLVTLNFAVALLADYVLTRAPRAFNVAGLRAGGFGVAIDFLAAYLAARALRRPAVALSILVVSFSIDPVAHVGALAVESIPSVDPEFPRLLATYLAASVSFTLWGLVMCYRVLRLVDERDARHLLPVYLLYVAVLITPGFLPRERFWQTRSDDQSTKSTPPSRPQAVTWEEGEDVLNAQPGLVRDQDARLLPGRKGIVDLYFVGFASYADQDVFFKEVTYAKDLFDARFDTRGRSVLLVNNRQTKDTLPVASVTNLRATLLDVGGKMNRSEDVLFLLLASHGSRDHKLSVRNGYLPLHELTAEMVSDALQKARIKWRVVVVDACYSGAFVEPLKDEYTMVMTSASSTHTSYGCGDDAEMTYFARAFLRHGLSWKYSFAESFQDAASLIRRWETTENRSHSEPQIFVGRAIAKKLEALDQRLRQSAQN